MTATPLFYWNDKLGKTNPRTLQLCWQITGAKTVVGRPIGAPALVAFDAIASQAVIDDFLGTTDEFLVADFDATAMGADAMAVIINMGGQDGQASYLAGFTAKCISSSGATIVERGWYGGSLTASTLETACELGAYGNLAVKINWGNTPDFDALTDGYILLEVQWISK